MTVLRGGRYHSLDALEASAVNCSLSTRGQACFERVFRGHSTHKDVTTTGECALADTNPPHVGPSETRCLWGQISRYPLIPALTKLEPEV